MDVVVQVVAMAVIAGIGVWAAHEVKATTLAALDTIQQVTQTAIQATTPPTDAVPAIELETAQAPGLPADVDWDPTDAAFGLADADYEPFVPRYGNDAGPKITHPLGIPNLERPYPVAVSRDDRDFLDG